MKWYRVTFTADGINPRRGSLERIGRTGSGTYRGLVQGRDPDDALATIGEHYFNALVTRLVVIKKGEQ